MKRILLLCILALVLTKIVAQTKPNMIIIYTDDQGYGDVSALNPESKIQTPNMDRLINEGINFTNGHSSGSACTPSRYGLLTGRYPWRTKLKEGVGDVDEPSMITENRLTIGAMLQQNGYNTACVGKWHLGMKLPGERGNRDWSQPIKEGPLDRGFDYWYGIPTSPKLVCAWFENRGLAPGAAEPTLLTYHKKNLPNIDSRWRIMKPYYTDLKDQPKNTIQNDRFINEVAPDWEDDQLLTRYTEKAIEWIGNKADEAKKGTPFFLYFAMTSPHEPVAPRADFIGKSQCGGYGDFVMETDYHIGKLLDYLDKEKLKENTIVIFTSDNGPENTWKERIKEFGHYSSGVLRDGKRSQYEGGHRVPFAIRWPKLIKTGSTWGQPVCQVDVMATVAEVVGAKIPDNSGEDSFSFLKVLKDDHFNYKRPPLVVTNNRSGTFAITEAEWKLVLPSGKNGSELYHVSADLSEKKNVISENPEVAKTLEEKLTKIVCNGRTTDGVRLSNDTGWWPGITWLTTAEYEAKHPEGKPVKASSKKNVD